MYYVFLCYIVLLGILTVSYTHLDVYKRQLLHVHNIFKKSVYSTSFPTMKIKYSVSHSELKKYSQGHFKVYSITLYFFLVFVILSTHFLTILYFFLYLSWYTHVVQSVRYDSL